jgi:hypothetical protein
MSTPTIPAGNLFMNATTYTGNGGTNVITNGVAGQSFQPDFVWGKSRSLAQQHLLFDSVRGTGKYLQSQSTAAEGTDATTLSSFNSNGFTLGSNITINTSASTNVAWQWLAGGTAVSNTSGSITSQVSANTTSGFSVATFTSPASGAFTVGHGLGVTPAFIISKARSISNWICQHKSIGTQYLLLQTTDAAASNATIWNSAPTSSVINFGSGFAGSYNYVVYSWAEIAGYSAFGSYIGNGSADGPFIYTGFRPRWIMIKRTDGGTANWYLLDSARSPYNLAANMLFPNLSAAETSTAEDNQDFLSNGFKVRTSNAESNTSGGTYIYAAFAENPFKYANAR